MNDLKLKQIPKRLSKSIIRYELYSGESIKLVDDAIEVAMRHVRKEKYNRNDKHLSFRELKYVVAQLDNPRGYEPILTLTEIKTLQQELER